MVVATAPLMSLPAYVLFAKSVVPIWGVPVMPTVPVPKSVPAVIGP